MSGSSSNFKRLVAVAMFAVLALLPALFLSVPAQAADTGFSLTNPATAGKSEAQVLKIAAGEDTINLGEKAVPLGELREKPEATARTPEARVQKPGTPGRPSEIEEGSKRERGLNLRIEKRKPKDLSIVIGDQTYGDGKDIVRFGEDVVVAETDTIDGDVVSIGGTVTVNGMVSGDVVSIGGSINIGPSGVIEGDGVSVGGSINREPGAVLKGDEVVTGGNIPKWIFRGGWPRYGLTGLKFAGLAFAVGKAMIVLFVAWLIVLISRDRVRVTSDRAKTNMLGSFGVGLLVMVLTPIAMVLLCITIIGIPVAILLPFALIVAALFGYTAVGLALGDKLFGGKTRVVSAVEAALLGVLVIEGIPIAGRLIGLPGGIMWGLSIPVRIVGYGIMVCAFLIGLGATILSKLGQPSKAPFQGGAWPPGNAPPAPGMSGGASFPQTPGAPSPGTPPTVPPSTPIA